MERISVPVPPEADWLRVLGVDDVNLRSLEEVFPTVNFWVGGENIFLQGSPEDLPAAEKAVRNLLVEAQNPRLVKPDRTAPFQASPAQPTLSTPKTSAPRVSNSNIAFNERAVLVNREKVIRPKTPGQASYVRDIETHTVTFGIGPAGTGKTYLAMARAVRALLDGEVSRLILTRPAVEAGETLGFLPGTLTDKIDPYLRPLYDALREMLDTGTISKLMSDGTIEVAALAYMRGRTLNGAFVILDEAQNTTSEQMKMFLTRLGFGSKMVVTGDITQIDLPSRQTSGLKQVRDILSGVPDIAFSLLTSQDVVRHSLVGEIIEAYQAFESGD